MSAPYFLRCMGYPELTRPDGRAVRFKVRKHLALLVYFVIEPRLVHRRESLVELLWRGVPLERGRHSLSMALSVLRSVLGAESLSGSVELVRFDRSRVATDLERLTTGHILGNATTLPLEVDGLLADFDIPDAPAFGHWREQQHARLLPFIQSGLLTLADHARRTGDVGRLRHFADRLLAIDALAEEGIRAKMEAFALQGDRVSALRAYEEWKRELATQVGAQPGRQLEGVAERLRRRGTGRPAPEGAPETVPGERPGRPFVGRSCEYRSLFEAWEGSTQLDPQHVLLIGETGMGKSTLALRFATAASLEGAAVARVQCFELEQRIAFGTIGTLVMDLLERPGAMATAPEWLAEIARVVPRVRERFPHLPRPQPSDGETARLRFAEGLIALLEAVMDEQPLVVIIDDYPRSDEASLAVLHLLLRRALKKRLMVILCSRPPEAIEPMQAARLRHAVAELPLRAIELTPLSEREAEAFLDAVFAREARHPSSPARRALLRAAAGNPMALELLSQDWSTHGESALALSLPAMRPDVPATPLQAPAYDRLLERMLPDLPPRTRLALHLATVLGRRLNDFNAFELVDLTERQSVAAITDLVSRGLLREADGRLEFTNELIRARLYLRIPGPLRRRLHDAVATRLLSQVGSGEKLPGLEVAWHCIRARRTEEGTPFLLNGARESVVRGEADEAARALSTSIAHLNSQDRPDARLLLAEACQEMGDWKGSLEYVDEPSYSRQDAQGNHDLANVLRIEAERRLGRYPSEELPDIVKRLILLSASTPDRRARVQAIVCAASIASSLRRDDLLSEVASCSQLVPTDNTPNRELGRLLLAQALAYFHLRDYPKGLAAARKAESVLQRGGIADSTYVQIQIGLGLFATTKGQYEEGVGPLNNALAGAEHLDNNDLIVQAANALALCHKRMGNKAETLRCAEIAYKTSQSLSADQYNRVWSTAALANAQVSIGRMDAANSHLDWLAKYAREAELPWIRQASLLFKADLEWQLGNRTQARRTARKCLALGEGSLPIGFAGSYARWAAIALRGNGNWSSAWGLLERLIAKIDQLDAIDQAELLCASEHLRFKFGLSLPVYASAARQVLQTLPLACVSQIRASGLRLPH